MNQIRILYFAFFSLSGTLISCKQFLQPQSWSQNYAQVEGTTANHASIIDGNYETGSKAELVNQGGSDIVIILPVQKWVSKVIIFSQQLNDPKFKGKKCNLYIKDENKWNEVKLFPIQGFRTEVRLPAVKTNQVRIRVPNRLNFRQMSRIVNKKGDVHNQKFYDSISPIIEEIELYGPIDTMK